MLPRSRPLVSLLLAPLLVLASACGGDGGDGGDPVGPEPPERRLVTVEVTPSEAAPQRDSVVDFDARAFDQDGQPIQDVEFSWSVEDPDVAEVDAEGRVSATRAGETSVTASARGEEGTAELKVRSGQTVTVDSTRMELVSDSADRAAGRLRFRIRQGSSPDVEEGDILVGAEDGGFLRRVEQVSVTGDEVVAETERASLADAVDSASFETSVSFGTGEQVSALRADGAVWGPAYVRYSARGVSVGSGQLTLDDVTLFSREFCGEEELRCARAEIVVTSGRIVFRPDVDLSADVEFFELNRFRAVGRGELEFDADVEATATGSYRDEGQTKIHEVGVPFSLPPGTPANPSPIPVRGEVLLSFSLGYTTSAEARYSLQTGFESSFGSTVGAEYANGNWDRVFSVDESLDPSPLVTDFRGEAQARVFVEPELSVHFYTALGAVSGGPSVFLTPFLEGQALVRASQENCSFDLTAGMDGGVDFEVEVLDSDVAEFERSASIATTTLLSEDLGCTRDEIFLDFESFDIGTKGEAFTRPGVTFTTQESGARPAVIGHDEPGLDRTVCPLFLDVGNCEATLVVDFDRPVDGLTFLAVGDDEGGTGATVEVFSGGERVATRSIETDGDFSTTHPVDFSGISDVTGLVISHSDPAGLSYDDFRFEALRFGNGSQEARATPAAGVRGDGHLEGAELTSPDASDGG